MSFQTEIYPYRTDRTEFPRRLLAKVDAEFTRIESVGGRERRTLGGSRCQLRLNQGPAWWYGGGEPRTVCDYGATLSDKTVAKALLKGWLRELSDRYLDYPAVRALGRRTYRSDQEAYGLIRQNAPSGAVKFLYNELPLGGSGLTLFGADLPQNLTYNQYFSMLTAWDADRCFGLLLELSRLGNLLGNGGGSSVGLELQAARLWIFRNQTEVQNSVYHYVAKN